MRAWNKTYGLPVLITHCSNNYGPRQFPEKLIPLIIVNALSSKPLPIYGDGRQIRDWLFVGDHVRALMKILQCGRPGEEYGIGGESELPNVMVVNLICEILDRLVPSANGPRSQLITYVRDQIGRAHV